MSNLPKLHPRERIVAKAENDLRTAVAEAVRDLTTGEELRVLAAVFGDRVGGIAKYAIRDERHGKSDKPGGLA
jgi:hypothetical protein